MHDDEEFEICDQRQERFASGGRPSFSVPPGLALFNNKREGSVKVDFIPFQVTDEHLKFVPKLRLSRPKAWYPERTYLVHGGIGMDNASYTCSYETFGERCPICDVRRQLHNSKRPEDIERSYEIKPKFRQLYLLIERNAITSEIDGTLKLWEESLHSFGKQLDQYIGGADPEDREAYRYHYHPDRGYTIRIVGTKESTGDGGGKYTKWSVHEFRQRKEPLPRDIYRHGYDLDALVRKTPYEELKTVFLGVDEAAETADRAATGQRGFGRVEAPPPRGTPPAGGRASERRGEEEAPVRDTHRPPAERNPEPEPTPPPRNTYRSSAENPPRTPTRTEREPEPRRSPPREPEPTPRRNAAPKFASLDKVGFKSKGESYEGTIVRVNEDKRNLQVSVEGWERTIILDFDEVWVISSDNTFDLPGAEDRTPSPPPRQRNPDPEPEPTIRRTVAPPAARREPEPDDQPSTRRNAPTGGWDDDDGQSFERKR